MLGELVRRHAPQQHTADAQVDVGTVLFWDQRISRLLDPVVQVFVGAILMDDEASVDGFPEGRVHGLLCFPESQARVAIGATLPRQASCFRASWVVEDNRFSFSAIRSTTLSV